MIALPRPREPGLTVTGKPFTGTSNGHEAGTKRHRQKGRLKGSSGPPGAPVTPKLVTNYTIYSFSQAHISLTQDTYHFLAKRCIQVNARVTRLTVYRLGEA